MLGAWSVRCVVWADWIDCRCFLSLVFLGDARRLELTPCNACQQALLLNSFRFVPFALETCGYKGKEAVRSVNRLEGIAA